MISLQHACKMKRTYSTDFHK